MINLIPPVARKKVKREYWIRVVSVWMILVASALVMISLLKLPVYVLVNKQLDAFSSSYESAAENDQQFKLSEELIKDANDISTILSGDEDVYLFSDVITRIGELAGEGIGVNQFTLTREEGQVNLVIITGEADTRQRLADFKNDLEADSLFESAALPLSNLAKDVDIPFKIEIAPTKPIDNYDS